MNYEDRPEKDTPQHILDELREYGGENPHGEPIWRLVLAENCRIHCFGWQNHMTEGLNLEELPDSPRKGEGMDAALTLTAPTRIEDGDFWVPRYREVKGWILQRWFPPSAWGSRTAWESNKARDGKRRLLAAYPQRGDYMMMPCGPWASIPEAGDLRGAIRCYNAQQRRNPANFANYHQAQLAWERQERQAKADAYAVEIAAQHREVIGGTVRTVSTSAQKFRNQVSKHTAGGVNLGAAEKWG